MNWLLIPELLAFAGLVEILDRRYGVLLHGPEKNVLSFLAEIAYRLIPQGLLPTPQYPSNLFVCLGLQ